MSVEFDMVEFDMKAGIVPWMKVAGKEFGVHETPGPNATERIVEYQKTTTLPEELAESDETPWCSSFVNACLEWSGIPGTKSAAAKSWLNWGVEAEPYWGSIIVIKRKARGQDAATGSGSGYHVGFLWEFGEEYVKLLGGNQQDSVNITRFMLRSYDIVGVRWPSPV